MTNSEDKISMKSKKKVILFILSFLIGLLFPINKIQAAMCSGYDCTGLFADSSCGATGTGTPFTINYAYIEMRQSQIYCKAQWTRITNKNISSRWTAGATRYGGLYYEMYYQPIQSAAPIGYNYSVFTPMVGNDNGVNVIDTLSCGNTGVNQLSQPIGGSQPNNSIFCSSVW